MGFLNFDGASGPSRMASSMSSRPSLKPWVMPFISSTASGKRPFHQINLLIAQTALRVGRDTYQFTTSSGLYAGWINQMYKISSHFGKKLTSMS